MPKPSPGPWSICLGDLQDANRQPICRFEERPEGVDGELIKYAPELLGALEQLLIAYESLVEDEYCGTSLLEDKLAEGARAWAVIAKVTGESKS